MCLTSTPIESRPKRDKRRSSCVAITVAIRIKNQGYVGSIPVTDKLSGYIGNKSTGFERKVSRLETDFRKNGAGWLYPNMHDTPVLQVLDSFAMQIFRTKSLVRCQDFIPLSIFATHHGRYNAFAVLTFWLKPALAHEGPAESHCLLKHLLEDKPIVIQGVVRRIQLIAHP